ncbi:MAG: LamG domain-containing protein [Labilithrix sp.]|nr:LamG domain-containing protein [Labilithrix sp.]
MRSRLVPSAAAVALALGTAAACGTMLPEDDASFADGGDAAPPAADAAADGATVEAAIEGGRDYHAEVMADEPVAYYRFEEDSDATSAIDEMGAHPGVYQGPSTIVRGLAGEGHARKFEVDSAGTGVSVASDAAMSLAFAGARAMSVEVWIQGRPASPTEGVVLGRFANGVRNFPNGGGYGLFVSDTVRFVRQRSDNAFSVSTESSEAFPLDGTRHVVATYDGKTVVLYVDGVRSAAADTDVELESSSSPLLIGAGVEPFLGPIDEVAVYAHALPPERVKAHYDAR